MKFRTSSKKSVTKLNHWLIFITIQYPYVLLCISATYGWFDIDMTFLNAK